MAAPTHCLYGCPGTEAGLQVGAQCDCAGPGTVADSHNTHIDSSHHDRCNGCMVVPDCTWNIYFISIRRAREEEIHDTDRRRPSKRGCWGPRGIYLFLPAIALQTGFHLPLAHLFIGHLGNMPFDIGKCKGRKSRVRREVVSALSDIGHKHICQALEIAPIVDSSYGRSNYRLELRHAAPPSKKTLMLPQWDLQRCALGAAQKRGIS